MFVVDFNQIVGLILDGKLLFQSQIYVYILGINLVVGYVNIIVGIYSVLYFNFNMVIGGILFGKVGFEFYGFLVGFLM